MLRNSLIAAVISTLVTLLPATGTATTVVHNVRGYTSTADGIRAFSVLAFDEAGKVVATGDEALRQRYPDATEVDGGGRCLLPGLVDAHAHLSSQGFLATSLDLAGVPTLAEALSRIEAYARANPSTRMITGRGWNQVLWADKRFPTAADIDAVVADRPVWLRRIDGHAGWANSRMLDLAGIDNDTPDPVGGRIMRDADGKATGVLVDLAMNLADAVVPPPDKREIRLAYLEAIESLVAMGMTGMHDAGIDISGSGSVDCHGRRRRARHAGLRDAERRRREPGRHGKAAHGAWARTSRDSLREALRGRRAGQPRCGDAGALLG